MIQPDRISYLRSTPKRSERLLASSYVHDLDKAYTLSQSALRLDSPLRTCTFSCGHRLIASFAQKVLTWMMNPLISAS